MALTCNGSTQYISKSGAILTAAPLTFACWLNSANTGVNSCLINIASQATNTTYFMLYASNVVFARTVAAGTGAQSATTTTFASSTWVHCAAVFTSASSRTAYLNGSAATTNTASLTPSFNSPITAIGANFAGNTTVLNPLNGTIAWPGAWNIALSTAEIAALAGGLHPSRMHPEALVSQPMLQGNSPEIDLVSSSTWALTAGPTLAANPSIYPQRDALTFTPSALSGTVTFSPQTVLTLAAQMAQQPSLSVSPQTVLTLQEKQLDNAVSSFNIGTVLTLNANDFTPSIINQYLIFPPGNINEYTLEQ